MDRPSFREPFDPELVRKLVEHDDARRELLWLRAREKRDRRSIQGLRRADAALAARMQAYEKPALALPDPAARAEAFRVLQDEAEAHWARFLSGKSCVCGRCRIAERW
jgi:hypothetical protein